MENQMAYIFEEPSHTFDEYLLIPGYTGPDCIPANVSLQTPVVRYNKKAGEKCPLTMNIPMTSAVMLAVCDDNCGIVVNAHSLKLSYILTDKL